MRMSQHKAAVGAFSIIGTLVLVFGIMVLGGGQLFSKDTTFVVCFDTSVSGLQVGAPVVFRGVALGTVTNIGLAVTSDMSNALIPVTIRINTENLIRATRADTGKKDEETVTEIIHRMISNGMRAKLQLTSMVTGQYRIELGFHPDDDPIYRSDRPEKEIPTMASPMDSFQKALETMQVEDMLSKFEQTFSRINAIVTSGEIERALTNFADAMEKVGALMESMQSLPVAATKLLDETGNTVGSIGKAAPPAMASFQKAMDDLAGAARELRTLAQRTHKEFGPTAPMHIELEKILKEFSATSRALRNFTSTIEQNPEALIRGRNGAY